LARISALDSELFSSVSSTLGRDPKTDSPFSRHF
jgi:hypothetical protein